MSAPHQNIIVSTIKQLTTNIQVAVFTRSSLTVIKVICQSEIILYISFRDKYTNHKPKYHLLSKKLLLKIPTEKKSSKKLYVKNTRGLRYLGG